jgi:hypothetical protein
MSATPFIIQPGKQPHVLHIVNTANHTCIATLKGKTARKRAMKALEWLRVGYFSNCNSKK